MLHADDMTRQFEMKFSRNSAIYLSSNGFIFLLLIVTTVLSRRSCGEQFKIPDDEPKNKAEWGIQAKETLDMLKGRNRNIYNAV